MPQRITSEKSRTFYLLLQHVRIFLCIYSFAATNNKPVRTWITAQLTHLKTMKQNQPDHLLPKVTREARNATDCRSTENTHLWTIKGH